MGGLFSAPKAPPPPEMPEPVPMMDEEAVKRAKQRAMRSARSRGGRMSTLLSAAAQTADGEKKLGG